MTERKKLPTDDPRAAHVATSEVVDLAGLAAHLEGRNRWVLATSRADGRPQMSLVTGGMTSDRKLAISTYPERAKVINARRDPQVSVAVLGEQFDDAWVQIDGDATVLEMPEAGDAFVEYFRCISGEHPDWDEYRQAMADQGKCLILIEPTRWGPISTGGFPPSLFED